MLIRNNNFKSVQEWLPYEKVYNNGIIKLKDSNYIKIIEVYPINYNLKSELEKEAILNSYKIFLKTCNFNLQILIQSNKQNIEKHISNVNLKNNSEIYEIKNIANNYIKFIKELNQNKKASSKNFYIIIKNKNTNEKIKKTEENIFEELNENYFKIKDCLSRCGNLVKDIKEKKKIEDIIFSFINRRLYLL